MNVYLDHNATSPLRPEVREHWWGYVGENLGNPSSLHTSGRRARAIVDEARERIAGVLHVPEQDVIFTPSGSAANGLVLLGGVRARGKGCGLITSAIEHAAVLEPAAALEREGHSVQRLAVDREGRLAPERVAEAVAGHPGPTWVSVMAGNNEVGTCHQIGSISEATRQLGRDVRIHTDAVQALGKRKLDLGAWHVDAATLSPHKVGGPPGVGVLILRDGLEVEPLVHGGAQERGLVAGTEDAARCSAAAFAIELAVQECEANQARLRELTHALWAGLAERIPQVRLHGPPLDAPDRLPNTLNIGLPGMDGKVLVTRLDLEGLSTSAGSACASGAVEPSHVLLAMGYSTQEARAALRLSVGVSTTPQDIDRAVEILVRVATSLG